MTRRVWSPGGSALTPPSPSEAELRTELERLLDAGHDEEALALTVASAALHPGWAAAALLAAELRQLHFGGAPLDASEGAWAGAREGSEQGAPPSARRPSREQIAQELDRVREHMAPDAVAPNALRVAARLRPHARGRLGVWERTLLRSALP